MAQPTKEKSTKARLHAFINALDWSGHIEIGDNDRLWLATEISAYLNPTGDRMLCESCGHLQPIVIKTPLGLVCEECVESWQEHVDEIREDFEESV